MTIMDQRRRAFLQGCWSDASALAAPSRAQISTATCLARRGVLCDLCRDACEIQAIRFVPGIPVAVPSIVVDRCTACGHCITVCPVSALSLRTDETQRS